MEQRILFVALSALFFGCTPHVYSPPARTIPLETSASVGEGATSVQGSFGGSAAVFGPGAWHAGARVAHGVSASTELDVEGNATIIEEGHGVQSDAHRGIYSLRLGVKQSFSPHFALSFGLGGGGSAGGSHLSPDVGFVAGYDNPYVVPFASVRGFVSQPLSTREVVMVDEDATYRLRPEASIGYAWVTGVRIPLGRLQPDGHRRASLLAGFGSTHVFSAGEEDWWFGFNGGFEVRL